MAHEIWPKVMEFCGQSWSFVVSHGILPNLPPNCTKFVEIKRRSRQSAFSNILMGLQKVANAKSGREMVVENKKKWSWKSHGKLFSQVCRTLTTVFFPSPEGGVVWSCIVEMPLSPRRF